MQCSRLERACASSAAYSVAWASVHEYTLSPGQRAHTRKLQRVEADQAVPALTDDLDYWEVRFKSGEMMTLRAHGVTERDGAWVFVALMEGTPHYEYELARVPASLVAEVNGGWRSPPA